MKRSNAISTPAKRARTTAARRKVVPFRVPRSVRSVQTGFPKQLQMKLRYVTAVTLDWVGGVLPPVWLFSCNGCYDPDISGTGHQPMYFDQTMAVYNHYTVLSSNITATFAAQLPTGTASAASVCGIFIEDDTSVAGLNQADMCEQNSCKYDGGLLSFGQNRITVANSWSGAQAFGGNLRDNDDLQGTAASNPTEQQYFVLFAKCLEPTALTNKYSVHVTVEYNVVFDEIRNVTGS